MNKRLLVLVLSISSVAAYGYALGGLGGFLLGRGSVTYVVLGLAGGTGCALLALKLWREYLKEVFGETPKQQGPSS
ncbi:hypothetical protein TheveDRAFT_0153 [Thermanaerovibrio velox DSM 12556]|uniref:Uncharacterized protein n=1 Tax=Thermanaerovibrio velox DSM 12556 TaxID=926567 RepID=H0UND3_9BACT|nr:hypothetical protein TheveDRAFT_0153 [Thermanaerovibrio velox DSM 12556]